MSRYRNEIDNARRHINSLWIVIMILSGFLVYAFHGWSSAPDEITVYIPPELSSGATERLGDVPRPTVYAFGFYIWQQINRWSHDGSHDFADNIYRFSPYLTPQFQAYLLRDMERRGHNGELLGRVRALHEARGAAYEDSRVRKIAAGVWSVNIDALIEETVSGMEVKRTHVRYPLRVVRYDVDREKNPWGLALDGWGDKQPIKINPSEEKRDSE